MFNTTAECNRRSKIAPASTATHSTRRREEMEAATQLLEILGVDPVMTRSTVESLRRIQEEGVPAVGGDSVP